MRKWILILTAVLFVFSCQKSETPESASPGIAGQLADHLDLDSKVLQGPPRLISVTAPLTITFREAIAPGHLSGSVLDKNPFVFEPEIKGFAKWVSTSTLRFEPDAPWPAGREIKGILKGKILFGEQKNVGDYAFRFKVAEQEIISLEGDFEPVSGQKNTVRYKGVLTFAQPVNVENIEKDLAFRLQRKKFKLTIQAAGEPQKVTVISEPLVRGEKGQSFSLSLPKSYTASDDKWEKYLMLPAVNRFKVLGHSDMTDADQEQPCYGFRFSDPIEKDTDLSAYIALTPELDHDIRVSNKTLILSGDFMAGETYRIQIDAAFPSAMGTKLGDAFNAQFMISNIKPEIAWLSEGIYLPASNTYKLQFKSVNVARATLRVYEIFPQNIHFFIQNNALTSRKPARRNYWENDNFQDIGRVGKEIYQKEHMLSSERNRWIKTELDMGEIFRYKTNSVFVCEIQFDKDDLTGNCTHQRDDLQEDDLYFEDDDYYSDPCDYGYYYQRGTQSKILIASDIGLTVKKTEQEIHVFATNVLTAQPESGLELNLISYVNETVETQRTDGDGHAVFHKDGWAVVGRNKIALMKLDENPWQINNFDVSGVSHSQQGTDVFMYTDRGVHRPGDTVYLSAIIRMNRRNPPSGQPVLLEVKNPQGRVMLNKKVEAGPNGHVAFDIETDMNDPTGNWQADLMIGDQHFYKTLKIETVKPNRLKVQVDVPGRVLPPGESIEGTITSKYLFGAPAAYLKTVIRATVQSESFTSSTYPDFTFSTPVKDYETRSHTVLRDALDSDGRKAFAFEVPGIRNAPSMLRIRFQASVSEKGGSVVEASATSELVPYKALVGVRVPATRYHSMRIDESCTLPIVCVDPEGHALTGRKLEVTVYLNSRHWWYDYDNRDRRDFRTMSSTYKIAQTTIMSEDKPVDYSFKVEDRGQHYVEIRDPESGHEAGWFFYGSRWGGDLSSGEEKVRNTLVITGDRNVYQPGDQATVQFDTPDKSLVLFTLEQGGRLLEQRWVRGSAGKTRVRFDVTEAMIPNCYAVISVIQPHAQSSNDLPMRVYGVKTIYVEDARTRLPLVLTAPDELRPKQNFKVSVKSGARQDATCTIAIVDEGLLDLTLFGTPDPWQHFFQKIRLAVNTSDNYDEIIGALLPDMDKYISIGGGLDEEAAREARLGGIKVKRFVPVVMFQKPVTVPAGRTKSFEFTMPNYVGAVRVMLVGAAGHSYTSDEKTIPVKQPLMILPTVPRVARPGDAFALPVSVFAMDSTIRQAELTLSVSDNLKVSGPQTLSVQFEKPEEKDVTFQVSTLREVGAGKISVMARSGSESADYSVDLPLNSPNPFYTEVTDTVAEKGETVILIPEKFGIEGTNHARLAFSRMPDIQLQKRMNGLIRYPYGCIEQTTSSAFPQLFIPYLLDLEPWQKQQITDNINATIQRMQQFKIGSGFGYWPNSSWFTSEYNDWGTSYLGHFLIHARALGYHVPDNLYNHWLDDARRRANRVNKDDHRYQTYRLYLLALAGEPQMSAMNLLRENRLADLDVVSRKLLAAAYALAGQKNVALEVDRAVPTEINPYRELGSTFGSALRDRSLLACLCVDMGDTKTAGKLLQTIARSYRPYGWYSTQETAMTILALGSYYKSTPFTGGGVRFTLKKADGKKETIELLDYQKVIDIDDQWDKKITVTNESANPLFVTLLREGVPLESRINTEQNGLQIARNFYDEDGNPVTVDVTESGRAFWVIYTVESLYRMQLENLALSSIFPTGWEIVNNRLTGEPLPQWIKRLRLTDGDYMDIRDDRINWFFDLPAHGKVVLGTKINPSFRGDYVLPPVAVEAMYSPEYYGRIKAGRARVE
ncbi:hypothetical protein JW948_05825 [bacterium]|nr:hypothetical protein [bacterium]